MVKVKFKIGDNIKVIEGSYKDATGIIVDLEDQNTIKIKINTISQTTSQFGSGMLIGSNPMTLGNPRSRSMWISGKELKKIQSSKTKTKLITTYKAGMSIRNYIKKLLKIEKDKERIKWLRTFDNCVLPDKVREIIEEALTVVLRADVFDEWGINDHFEKGLTNSILIYGPPGTGKTMVSESIASILGLNLMKLTNADIQSNIPGQTEKNISASFKKAKDEKAVVMFDECDSVLYNRNAVGAILAAEINHLLMEIERFDGVVLLTTNRLHKLDEALQRRIIAKVELPFPNKDIRKKIWEKLIPDKMPIDDVDFTILALAKLSGGEIKNAILLSARKAIAQNRKKVVMNDFLISIENIIKSKKEFEEVQPTTFIPR